MKKNDNNGNILIFDLGGGTFDVTLLSINKDVNNKDIFNVLSTKGEKFLGGEDFDNKLVEYFLDKFCEKMNLKKEDVKKDKKAIRKLKISCEKIKRVLSSTEQTQLYIYNFYDNKDILEKISCSIFEFLCKDLIEKLRKPLLDVISDAKISKNDISEIVLVGGSTRLKMVRRFINKFFNGCKIKINDTINPDEAIAYGATLMAAKISKKKIGSLAGFNLMDITPLSLGIETHNDSKDSKVRDRGLLMSVIIKRGVKIPHSNTRTYWTVSDYQTSAKIAIYEGEKKYVNENHKLGEVIMSNLTKKPRGEVKIDINFYIDVNGILTVTGTEKDKKNNKILIEIKNDNVNLTREEVEKLRQKNEKYQNMNPNLTLDYNNLKKTLREFQKIYDTSTNDNEKYNILMSYNSTLEEFIDFSTKTVKKEAILKYYDDNFIMYFSDDVDYTIEEMMEYFPNNKKHPLIGDGIVKIMTTMGWTEKGENRSNDIYRCIESIDIPESRAFQYMYRQRYEISNQDHIETESTTVYIPLEEPTPFDEYDIEVDVDDHLLPDQESDSDSDSEIIFKY